jgi:hypothetical protein
MATISSCYSSGRARCAGDRQACACPEQLGPNWDSRPATSRVCARTIGRRRTSRCPSPVNRASGLADLLPFAGLRRQFDRIENSVKRDRDVKIWRCAFLCLCPVPSGDRCPPRFAPQASHRGRSSRTTEPRSRRIRAPRAGLPHSRRHCRDRPARDGGRHARNEADHREAGSATSGGWT